MRRMNTDKEKEKKKEKEKSVLIRLIRVIRV
jgi:hypothetical protein